MIAFHNTTPGTVQMAPINGHSYRGGMWAGHARPAGAWFSAPASPDPPVCTDTVIDAMWPSGDPPGGGAKAPFAKAPLAFFFLLAQAGTCRGLKDRGALRK